MPRGGVFRSPPSSTGPSTCKAIERNTPTCSVRALRVRRTRARSPCNTGDSITVPRWAFTIVKGLSCHSRRVTSTSRRFCGRSNTWDFATGKRVRVLTSAALDRLYSGKSACNLFTKSGS